MYIILFYFFEGSLRFRSKGYDISKVVGLSKSKDKNYQCPRSRSLVFTNLLEVFRKLKQKSISYKLLDFCIFIIIFAFSSLSYILDIKFYILNFINY